MIFAFCTLALLVAGAVSQSCTCTGCTVNDCYRVVAGTEVFPAQPTVSDCRSFMWEVITVPAATITVTVTGAIATVTETKALVRKIKREEKTIPAYAVTACGRSADFASACGCIGISSGSTSYAHTPGTETFTAIASPTATATELVSFYIRAQNVAANGDFAGLYWNTIIEQPSTYNRLHFISGTSGALIFKAGPDGNLAGADGTPFAADNIRVGEQVYLQHPVNAEAIFPCKLNPSDKSVVCGNIATNQIYVSGNVANHRMTVFNNSVDISKDSCFGPLTFEAVPIS
ncbi:hypothetical protein TWF694_006350 [Orbilia ellipsospora]|uniref:Uncharacterized protein n=1 Tax=Orbilia ellipsospora TaxID=2528407 RepID=A0AAV9XJY8_9PEZI